MKMVSPADVDPSLFVVIEMRGYREIRLGRSRRRSNERAPALRQGLDGYRAYEVFNSRWIKVTITVNSVHPHHSDALFRRLHHYALLFHDEMLEVLTLGLESYLAEGAMREIMVSLTDALIEQPHHAGR